MYRARTSSQSRKEQEHLLHSPMGNSMEELRVNLLTLSDMDDVLSLEDDLGAEGWTDQDYKFVSQKRNCIRYVARLDNKIIGVLVYDVHKDFINILRVVIRKEFRRRKFGTNLVSKILPKLKIDTFYVDCMLDESSLEMQLFFKSLGFVGTLHRSDTPQYEDRILMTYKINVNEGSKTQYK